MAAFALKKSLISKLRKITTIASVRITNSTRLRIAMTSPMQSKARGLLPWFDILCQAGIWFLEYNDFWFYAKSRTDLNHTAWKKLHFFQILAYFAQPWKVFWRFILWFILEQNVQFLLATYRLQSCNIFIAKQKAWTAW